MSASHARLKFSHESATFFEAAVASLQVLMSSFTAMKKPAMHAVRNPRTSA